MRKPSIIAAILFLAFSVVVMVTSRSMDYYSSLGPGPGFFPFWLGLLLTLLSAVWLVQCLLAKRPEKDTRFFPQGQGLLRVLAIIGSLVLMFLFMERVGFQLMMFAFLVFLLIALGRVNPWLTLAIAIAGSFGLNFVFTRWLDVQLPASAIPFLAALGL